MSNGEMGIGYAKELTIQLITLSTGLVGLSITFGKEVIGRIKDPRMGTLSLAWVLHLLSIIFGIWTLMALTGTLLTFANSPLTPDLGPNERLPAMAQVVTFLTGTILLVVFYGRRVGVKPTKGTYKVIEIRDDDSGARLGSLAADGWEVVSLSAHAEGHWSVVIKRQGVSG